MRNAFTLCAVLVGTSAVSASAAAPGDAPAFSVESRRVDQPVTYRFMIDIERPQSAFDGGGQDPNAGGSGSRPTPPPAQPQTIRFTTFDLDHVRLTELDASDAETKETLVVEHDPDGQLHARLKRGSHWALPLALYDRLVVLANAASAPVYPGKPVTAKLQPIAGSDELDGTLTTHPGRETHVVYDASGPITPSRDLIDAPDGARGGPGGFGGGGGGMGGGGRFGGGRGRRGGEDGEARKADATMHVDAVFRDASLQHAESTESLAFGTAGMTTQQHWSVVRVP